MISPADYTLIGRGGRTEGHTAKVTFTPSDAKWLDGELVHIEVEK